jgi:hypothetical protein
MCATKTIIGDSGSGFLFAILLWFAGSLCLGGAMSIAGVNLEFWEGGGFWANVVLLLILTFLLDFLAYTDYWW